MTRHQQGQQPADFDPATHPIISRHYFGIEPPRSNILVSADAIAEYTLALPFLIQLRYVRDFPGPFVEVAGTTVFLAYIVPF